jgi:hypothetical protein
MWLMVTRQKRSGQNRARHKRARLSRATSKSRIDLIAIHFMSTLAHHWSARMLVSQQSK